VKGKEPLKDLHSKDKSVLAWKQPRASSRKKVLFICTSNSARSQMAEGWLRHLYGARYDAHSAGARPGRVHPLAIDVMAEEGVDISSERSKSIEETLDDYFDLVVTLCDEAREECPVYPGASRLEHEAFDDPESEDGTNDELVEEFRKVRDEIRAYVERRFGGSR
jgi:arsenate reductase